MSTLKNSTFFGSEDSETKCGVDFSPMHKEEFAVYQYLLGSKVTKVLLTLFPLKKLE